MTMRSIAVTALLAVVLSLFGTSSRALALATEHFGNEPVPAGFLNLGVDALAFGNLKQRIYWYEVNGNPTFFYRGDATSLNEALQKFAAIPKGEVVFMPGRGQGHSLGGEKTFDYDWWFNFPEGIHRKGVPTLTVYIAAVDPLKQPDAKQLAGWIADLDSDAFATRTKASEELKKLGHDAAPALRRALANNPSAEVRNAIEHLLGVLDGMDIREVKVPKGVKVLEVKDLLARYREELKASDGLDRGLAANALGFLADYADVVPDLIGVLKEDAHEYARRCAAGRFSRLGKRATSALPVLKAGLEDPDVNVRNAFAYAIKQIEEAKETKDDELQVRRQKALLEGISAAIKALPAAAKE